jgi:hypothetical protein
MSAAKAAVDKQLLSMEQHTFFVTAQALCKPRGFKQSPRLLTGFSFLFAARNRKIDRL